MSPTRGYFQLMISLVYKLMVPMSNSKKLIIRREMIAILVVGRRKNEPALR
jgi:hypothetical protein